MESKVVGKTIDTVELADIPRTCLVDKTECNSVWACCIDGKLYCLKGAAVDSAASLLRERDALAALKGVDGVPQLHTTFRSEEEGHVFLLKRFACGSGVEKLFYAVPRLSERLALHVTLQVALILSAVHERGLVYRDLKANNVILNTRGEVFLIDMGHCTPCVAAEKAPSYGAFHARGPEVVLHRADTHALDYWSLGVLLFEMLTGKPPLGFADNDEEVASQLWSDAMPPALLDAVSSDADIRNLVCGLLTADPDRRLHTLDSIVSHPAFARSDVAKTRGGCTLDDCIVEEIEMQSLGRDENVAPPVSVGADDLFGGFSS